MEWVLKDNGDLCYGQWRLNDYHKEFSFCTPCLKVSQDNKWAAVIHNNTVDVYGVSHGENFYKYSLRFDPYKTHGMYHIFEFADDKFVMSREHGSLSVCDCMTGGKLHSDEEDDKFFIRSKIYGDVLVVHGYYWGVGVCVFLYKTADLMMTPDYKPQTLFLQDEKEYAISDDGVLTLAPVTKYATSLTLHEAFDNTDHVHDTLHDIDMTLLMQTEDFKKSVMWKLVAEPDFFTNYTINYHGDTRQELIETLTSGKLVHTKCIGNVSGRVFGYFIRRLVEKMPTCSTYGTKVDLGDDERRLNRLMFLTIFQMASVEHDIEALNFHIVFDDKIKMNVQQRFVRNEETKKYYTDDSNLCEIDVNFI